MASWLDWAKEGYKIYTEHTNKECYIVACKQGETVKTSKHDTLGAAQSQFEALGGHSGFPKCLLKSRKKTTTLPSIEYS